MHAWRTKEGLTLAQAGKLVGVSAPTFHDYENDRKRPLTPRRTTIELVTEIPASAWDTDAERELVERVRAEVGAEVVRPPSVPPPPARKAVTARTRAAVAKVAKAGDVATSRTGTDGR